ncbi:MAG: pyruvate kinase alpha/beta domain-containing protein [Smithellaceae bacterium]|nr:pyruvate kinase alpha/beta domain-containing protein [Smithellaceae bacterium]
MESAGYDTSCRYHLKPGETNTETTLERVYRRGKELSIKNILVPTCTGRSAFVAIEALKGEFGIIAVTHVTGFLKPDTQELSEENRTVLLGQGIKILTAQHAFGGVGRGVRNKLGTYQVDEIMAFALRVFGQGTKVAIELALMAADAGLIRTDEDVISLGGTSHGVDTALLLKPANSSNIFDLKVREVICKPAQF